MDQAQRLLFDGFPRAMGVTTPDIESHELTQYLVHSRTEFDSIVDSAVGSRNIYASLSQYRPVRSEGEFGGCAVVANKVSFDFDSTAKAPSDADIRWSHTLIDDDAEDHSVIRDMRSDSDTREAVLGEVCDDASRLAEACEDEDIPIFGVFSGFGLHIHQLRKETMSRPEDKMGSICRKWISELTLSTADERASGKPFRIMRVPNIERISHSSGENKSTGLYTIPLTAPEIAQIRPKDLLDLSRSPRRGIGSEPRSRPEMKTQEDYLGPSYEDGELGQEKMRPIPEQSNAEGFAETLVKKITRMPCVYKRALGPNPPNDVRVKLGIMFLNAGYTPEEITSIIAGLGWMDFDREVTKYQLEQLRKSGKGDWSCRTMQGKGLCVRADEKTECPTYGYRGGNEPWQT